MSGAVHERVLKEDVTNSARAALDAVLILRRALDEHYAAIALGGPDPTAEDYATASQAAYRAVEELESVLSFAKPEVQS